MGSYTWSLNGDSVQDLLVYLKNYTIASCNCSICMMIEFSSAIKCTLEMFWYNLGLSNALPIERPEIFSPVGNSWRFMHAHKSKTEG